MLFSGRLLAPRGRRLVGLVLFAAGAAAICDDAVARGPSPADVVAVARAELPPEAILTERAIRHGGPFPYAKDGSVFGNRERLLPSRPRGYWREYTVPSPGSRDRGPLRIVCGGAAPTLPDSCYFSSDHYTSFRRIEQ